MDPDIPMPSIEHEDPSNTSRKAPTSTGEGMIRPASIPLPASSPPKSPYKHPKSYTPSVPTPKITRSPSAASSYQKDGSGSPILRGKRSTPNLSVSRGTTPSRTQYRRASSNLNPSSPSTSFKSLSNHSIESFKPVVLTPSSVAKDYFRKELDQHSTSKSNVAVIVHDSCYGHRFSRPRTSKANLANIVERPERIHATVLGACTAYVRLGSRHANGTCGPHPDKNHIQEKGVPFQLRKTSRFVPLNHASVTYVHGTKWMEELQIMCDSAEGKLAINGKELSRPIGYGKDENGQSLPKLHEGDLYLCGESLSALQGCLGGVCDAVDAVLGPSPTERAFVCIRPPGHHCSSNFPSGFCWLNNVHVGISYAAMNYGLTHAAIIDFDLHHGDGSQSIAWDQNSKAHTAAKNAAIHKKTAIGYYSLHDINSYPCEWGDPEKVKNASLCIDNAHGQSIWNVHLESWKTAEEFWKLYAEKYTILLEKTRKFLRHHTLRLRAAGHTQPKAAIFISAGFDASEWEGAGMQRHQVNVPTDFYAKFTADIVELSKEDGLSVDGRVISVLEGGYSDRALTSGVLSHICGLVQDESTTGTNNYGTLSAMENSIGISSETQRPKLIRDRYSDHWWALDSLEALESLVTGHMPAAPKSKDKTGGNYSSPTQASTARMTEHAKERRSLSAQLESRLSMEFEAPPPPEVDWTVASYELSRLIIPSDRQTMSCSHEDLNAEAMRAKKERQSIIGVANIPDDRMQLRDRRSKAPALERVRSSSRTNNRRTTIAAVSELPDPTMGQSDLATANEGRPRRRSSAGSSILSGLQDMNLNESRRDDISLPQSGRTSTNSSMAPPSVGSGTAKAPVVKKSRVPTTKAPANPKPSPKKATGRGPSLSRKVSSSSDKATSNEKRSATSKPVDNSKADGLDDLTNGMKKVSIKLKLPSPEEHEARQKAIDEERQKKAEADKQKKPRAPKKTGVPKAIKPKTTVNEQPAAANVPQSKPVTEQPNATLTSEVQSLNPVPPSTNIPGPNTTSVTPINGQQGQYDPIRNTSSAGLPQPQPEFQQPYQHPVSQPANSNAVPYGYYTGPSPVPTTHNNVPQSSFGVPWAPQPPPSDIFINQQPVPQYNQPFAPPPVPAQQYQQIPMNHGQPQFSTPKKMTREDLPVFTSQSPIPFAPQRNAAPTNTEANPEQKPSIWDIPETPQH